MEQSFNFKQLHESNSYILSPVNIVLINISELYKKVITDNKNSIQLQTTNLSVQIIQKRSEYFQLLCEISTRF